jgi:hypothetical protein
VLAFGDYDWFDQFGAEGLHTGAITNGIQK